MDFAIVQLAIMCLQQTIKQRHAATILIIKITIITIQRLHLRLRLIRHIHRMACKTHSIIHFRLIIHINKIIKLNNPRHQLTILVSNLMRRLS